MQIATILKILGLLLMLFSLTLLPPIGVELGYQDGSLQPLIWALCLTFSAGFILWLPCRHYKQELRIRDGFIIVVLFWSVLCLISALPFFFSPVFRMSFTDSFFESVSGITTTGATVLTGIDFLPHSILYYRQQLQFLGGMGIIILAVAIFPMLGIGGMQLFKAESTGPIKDAKLTPRITQTAKIIWIIYIFLTLLCGIAYWIGGMSLFDAIGYSFATLSTGGYAPHDLNMAYYNTSFIKITAIIFMFLGAVSFNLHFLALHSRKLTGYIRDPEVRVFLGIMLASLVALGCGFYAFGLNEPSENLLDSSFQIVSIFTTTGFTTAHISLWPSFIPLLLLFGGAIGGCSGSTAGGIKIIRLLLLCKQSHREIKRLIHPHANYSIKLGRKPINNRIIEAIWGFCAIYLALFALLLLLLLLTEIDLLTAYSALLATLSNAGVGLGHVAHNFASLSDSTKWVLSFAMLVGRLEFFTILVLFSPAFWRN